MAQAPIEDDPIVLAPGGPRRRSTIRQIKHGHRLDMTSGRVLMTHLSGKVVEDMGPVPEHSEEENRLTRKLSPAVQWIVNAQWNTNPSLPITSFKTTWVVPPGPKTQNNQTIFLFNGTQDPLWILQPILQWGASRDSNCGNFWTVASWLADGENVLAYFTPLQRVNTGDVLTGIITLIGQRNIGRNTVFDYDCYFEGIPNTCLPVRSIQGFYDAVQVLEAYNSSPLGLPPSNCSDYPFVLKTAMKSIEIKSAEGEQTLTWTPINNITTCGQSCVVVSNASPEGEVDLNYFNPKPPTPPGIDYLLTEGQGLLVGQSLISDDKRFQSILQADGNLVLYGPQHQPLWASNTNGHLEVWDVVLQKGNLIMYDVLGGTIWSSGSSGTPVDQLLVGSNGNVVLSNESGIVWQTNSIVPSTPVQSTSAGMLGVNQGLVPGQSVISTDGRFTFTLQTDGNLVLYGPANQRLWASNTNGHEDVWSLVMQNDGNLVIYDGHGTPFWASNTQGHPGATLTVQDDGNVVIYDGKATPWSTGTVVPVEATPPYVESSQLIAGQGLLPGLTLRSPGGKFSFTMQSDGNLVLYGPQGQPIWATNTNGHTNIWNVIMQGDGNLVLYDAHSGVLWASNTQGNVGSYLAVLNSGNVVIYNVNNTIIWQTNTVVPTEPTAPTQGDRLLTNQGLVPGTSLVSSNSEFTWTFQLDGNIVLYGPNPCNQVMWASNTASHHNCWSLVMQTDGNLVAYDAHGGAFFATNTVGAGGTEVVLQADGNVVMYNSAQTSSQWSTNTYLPPVPSAPSSTTTLGVGQGIIAGQTVTSPNGLYNFTLQTDANVVFYGPGSLNSKPLPPVVWAAGTNGHQLYPWFLVMQGDGNLVAYDSAGKAYWASNTNGHPGATFLVVSTGKAAVADPSEMFCGPWDDSMQVRFFFLGREGGGRSLLEAPLFQLWNKSMEMLGGRRDLRISRKVWMPCFHMPAGMLHLVHIVFGSQTLQRLCCR